MYCVNEKPRSSLLIESTDSMILLIFYYYYELHSHMTGNDVSDENKRNVEGIANCADSIQPISGVAGVYRNIKG